jgi:hypothetical protein
MGAEKLIKNSRPSKASYPFLHPLTDTEERVQFLAALECADYMIVMGDERCLRAS